MKYYTVLLFIKCIFIFETFGEPPKLVTRLEQYRQLYLQMKQASMNYASENMDSIYAENVNEGKIQYRIPDSQPFPCDVRNTRSLVVPNSVNKIRPGDIDVIASIGDSLSAANGAISTSLSQIFNEFRSISFSGGGRANWRKFITLPNILKEFNPNLYGYAISDGSTTDSRSRLNIAEAMLMSRDLTFQSKVLINRMIADPNVDMKNHWKLLTIFVGNNDICSDICHHENLEDFLAAHENHLLKTLRMLRDNVPRLIVNIMPVPNMKLFYEIKGKPSQCEATQRVECHCIFNAGPKRKELNKYLRVNQEWQRREQQITNRMEFQTQDFEVIFHPFMGNILLPIERSGNTDLRLFARDCFHLSQLGHAYVANALWNSMMQPDGKKRVSFYPLLHPLECPTIERPFIATKGNSRGVISSSLLH